MRIGLFGGTFDPVHNAHLFVAESARRFEKLERVIFVPTARGHYRESAHADSATRCAMIVLAIAGNPAFTLDRSDLADDASGYTADLLPRLRHRYPGDDFTFIAGADSLSSKAWQRLGEVVAALEGFAIAPRAGADHRAFADVLDSLPPNLRRKVRLLDLPELPHSAALIRTLLAQGKSIRYLVPEPVWRYLEESRLYAGRDARS